MDRQTDGRLQTLVTVDGIFNLTHENEAVEKSSRLFYMLYCEVMKTERDVRTKLLITYTAFH